MMHFPFRLIFALGFILLPFLTDAGSKDSLIVLDKAGYNKSLKKDPNQQLVLIKDVLQNVKLDIRYSTSNNFIGRPVYTQAAAYARKEVVAALKKVTDSLRSLGLGLIVYDAYRPYSVTVIFWKETKDRRFVASPARGSIHNRGCAVDVGLYRLKDGKPLPMPTEYDDFSDNAHINARCKVAERCRNRQTLISVMSWAGFRVNSMEWWHFDYKDVKKYPVLNVSFEELKSIHPAAKPVRK